jgi:hypothetical protein
VREHNRGRIRCGNDEAGGAERRINRMMKKGTVEDRDKSVVDVEGMT